MPFATKHPISPLTRVVLRRSVNAVQTKRAEDHSHGCMAEIRLQELIRAGTRDHRNPMLAAHAHRILRYAGHSRCQAGFGSHQAVHPNPLDPEFNTLLHDLLGDLRVGQDEHRIWLFGN